MLSEKQPVILFSRNFIQLEFCIISGSYLSNSSLNLTRSSSAFLTRTTLSSNPLGVTLFVLAIVFRFAF